MANYDTLQPLTSFEGDVSLLISEMKRRAGVRTDTELSEFIGINQSTISTWKRRKIVPEQAVLAFEIAMLERKKNDLLLRPAAIAIVMRAAEFIYSRNRERGSTAGRWMAYSAVSAIFKDLIDAVEANLGELAEKTGRWTNELAAELIDSETYVASLADAIEQRQKERGPQ